MAVLLELKEKIKRIYGRYNTYIVPAAKFLVTLVAMLMLDSSIGYVSVLKSPLIAILVAIICAFMPAGFMVEMSKWSTARIPDASRTIITTIIFGQIIFPEM